MFTYISVDDTAVNGPCTSRVHGPCTRPYNGRIRPCTWRVHGRVRAMYTYIPVHVHVHACTRPLHGRERAAYGPCTRTCTRPCGRVHERVHGRVPPCTRPVYTALYGPCTRPCTRRAHCRVTVYTAGVHAYRCTRPRTRPVYWPLSAVYMVRTRLCKCRIYGPCTRT